MYENINFLRERVRIQEAILQSDKRVAFFTSIGLGVFLTLVVGTVSYSFFLRSQVHALEAALAQSEATHLTLRPVETSYLTRSSLLSLANAVITKRTKAWDAISYLYSIIPKESHIESINLSGQDGSLAFIVQSPSVFAYKNLSAILQSDTLKQSGYESTLGSLTRNADGSYSLEVKLFISIPKTPPPAVSEAVDAQGI